MTVTTVRCQTCGAFTDAGGAWCTDCPARQFQAAARVEGAREAGIGAALPVAGALTFGARHEVARQRGQLGGPEGA